MGNVCLEKSNKKINNSSNSYSNLDMKKIDGEYL